MEFHFSENKDIVDFREICYYPEKKKKKIKLKMKIRTIPARDNASMGM